MAYGTICYGNDTDMDYLHENAVILPKFYECESCAYHGCSCPHTPSDAVRQAWFEREVEKDRQRHQLFHEEGRYICYREECAQCKKLGPEQIEKNNRQITYQSNMRAKKRVGK